MSTTPSASCRALASSASAISSLIVGLHPPQARPEPHARSTTPTVAAPALMAARASWSVMPMHTQTYTLPSQGSGEHVGQLPRRRCNLPRGRSGVHETLQLVVGPIDLGCGVRGHRG